VKAGGLLHIGFFQYRLVTRALTRHKIVAIILDARTSCCKNWFASLFTQRNMSHASWVARSGPALRPRQKSLMDMRQRRSLCHPPSPFRKNPRDRAGTADCCAGLRPVQILCLLTRPASGQSAAAQATASAPAGIRTGLEGSVTARHTASATSCECVIGPGALNLAMNPCTRSE
jgi:hypothetical protein